MFKSAKILTLLGLLLVIALVGGLYLTSKNAADLDPIVVYKATPLPQKKTAASEFSGHSSLSEEPIDTSSTIPTPSKDVHEHATHEQESHWDDGTSPDESELAASVFEKMDFEEIKGSVNNDLSDEGATLREQIVQQLEDLTIKLEKKYPEVAKLGTMTLEELNALYPTSEDKKAIGNLAQQAHAEFIEDFRVVFSKLPSDEIEEGFAIVQEIIIAQWGTEVADQVMTKLRTDLDL